MRFRGKSAAFTQSRGQTISLLWSLVALRASLRMTIVIEARPPSPRHTASSMPVPHLRLGKKKSSTKKILFTWSSSCPFHIPLLWKLKRPKQSPLNGRRRSIRSGPCWNLPTPNSSNGVRTNIVKNAMRVLPLSRAVYYATTRGERGQS